MQAVKNFYNKRLYFISLYIPLRVDIIVAFVVCVNFGDVPKTE